MISIIIPAHNEAAVIGRCLTSVAAAKRPAIGIEVIVVANGCSDATVALAERFRDRLPQLTILNLPEGGKIGALNAGDALARGAIRVYLDADVVVSADIWREMAQALSGTQPRYASGKVIIPRATNAATRAFSRFYATVPFMRQGLPGCGLYAVNAAGRQRWSSFPQVIADDTFVRLQFSTEERLALDAAYEWPLVEGFRNLVRVRRRQDAGVTEIRTRFPELMKNDDKHPYALADLWRAGWNDPIGFLVYSTVRLLGKLGKNQDRWSRGR